MEAVVSQQHFKNPTLQIQALTFDSGKVKITVLFSITKKISKVTNKKNGIKGC